MTRPDYRSALSHCEVDVKTIGGKNGVFSPGDKWQIVVTNKTRGDVYIELVGTSAHAKMTVLTREPMLLRSGQKYSFPPDGPATVKPQLGKEHITVYACETTFPAGELLRFSSDEVPGNLCFAQSLLEERRRLESPHLERIEVPPHSRRIPHAGCIARPDAFVTILRGTQ